jgi:hypothetical protein
MILAVVGEPLAAHAVAIECLWHKRALTVRRNISYIHVYIRVLYVICFGPPNQTIHMLPYLCKLYSARDGKQGLDSVSVSFSVLSSTVWSDISIIRSTIKVSSYPRCGRKESGVERTQIPRVLIRTLGLNPNTCQTQMTLNESKQNRSFSHVLKRVVVLQKLVSTPAHSMPRQVT